MIDPEKTHILLGPPGTGKTHTLLDIMETELRGGVSSRRIGFMAFTKKAATLAKDRALEKFGLKDEDLPFFRTLHSLAFRQLGVKRDQVMQWGHYKELGEKLGMALRSRKNVEDGTTYGMSKEERLMFLEGLSRIKQEDLRKTWGDSDEEEIDWWELERFSRALKEYKASRLVIDYTDMIDQFVSQHKSTIPPIDILFIDEAQDLSPLQWAAVDRMASRAQRTYFAGDDDQCQPGDALVETTIGPIRMEDLDPKEHRLLSWRRDTHFVHGKNTGGFDFDIAKRWYSGPLATMSAAGKHTRCTPDHLWYVRFTDRTQASKTRVVYVMRKGDWFRVGECRLFGTHGDFNLWVRARLEGADAVWILGTFDSREESRVREQIISARYGLPQIVFNPLKGGFSEEATTRIFETINTRASAQRCLRDHGLCVAFPFFTPDRAKSKRGGTPIFELETRNILPGLMAVPLSSEREHLLTDEWAEVGVAWDHWVGWVYSLDVRPHHTYVADGLVTKNCIYKWAGAHVETFINLQGKVRVLDQSHRVPGAVHPIAESIAKQIGNRREKAYKPRDIVGDVKWYGDAEEVDLSKGTWLLLARNGYLLSNLEEMCVRNGFSFESVSKSPMQSDSLKAIKSWENLRRGNSIPIEEAMMIVKFASPGKTISRDTRELLRKADQESFVSMQELKSGYGFKGDAIWHESLDRIPAMEKEYFIAARKRGETLTKKPRITISTIHAAKGGEEQNVLLLTDMSYRTFSEMQKHPDDENRVWYVGVTRCSEALHVVSPKTNLCYEF